MNDESFQIINAMRKGNCWNPSTTQENGRTAENNLNENYAEIFRKKFDDDIWIVTTDTFLEKISSVSYMTKQQPDLIVKIHVERPCAIGWKHYSGDKVAFGDKDVRLVWWTSSARIHTQGYRVGNDKFTRNYEHGGARHISDFEQQLVDFAEEINAEAKQYRNK